jgi:hypothetical protein
MAEPAVAPRCAVHPDVDAQAEPCERCGAFACDVCFGLVGDEPVSADRLCKSCRDRVGHGHVAWEDPMLGFWARLFGTTRDALTEPTRTFRAIGDGSLGPAASYGLTTMLVGYGPLFALFMLAVAAIVFLGMGELADRAGVEEIGWALVCVLPVVLPAMMVAFSFFCDLYFAVVFHVTAMLLGGKGSFESSLRASLYTGAVRMVLVVLGPFLFVPLFGSVLNLAYRIFALAWCSYALAGAAKRVHRLDDGPALVAGAAPAVSVVLLFVGIFTVAVVVGLSSVLRT